MKRYLLDTNICLAYIRGHKLYKKVEAELNLMSDDALILISVVTKAELISLGIQNGWENNKIKKLESLLKKLFLININEADKNLIQTYARIDAFSQGKLSGLSNKYTSRNMGKNDLWVAATAYVTQAELITTDMDFDHLDSTFLTIHNF